MQVNVQDILPSLFSVLHQPVEARELKIIENEAGYRNREPPKSPKLARSKLHQASNMALGDN